MTLRRRVLAYLALAAIASCALTVLVAAVLVRHRIADQRMTALRNQATVLALVGGAPGARTAGEHVYRIGSHGPRRVRPRVAAAIERALPSGGDAQGTTHVDGRTILYVARTTAAGRVVLVRRDKLAFGEWRPFLLSLVLAGLGGALLAALLAVVLSRRLLAPIRALALATARVAAGEDEVAVPVSGSDELAGLGRAFNAMSEELERSRRDQQSFLESVSHELKTPLTSVRGYAEGLEEGAVDPAEGGRVITEEADRLGRLVSDLMDLARLRRAGFAAERAPVDLAAVGAAAAARHKPRARGLGVRLTAHGADLAWALADEDRLLQAVSNLVENALRLTPAGGAVTVSSSGAAITVTDTGPGLADADLPRAFERFYLHDRYRSERAVGTGLGLAIVAELAEAMGGRASAVSVPDGGARFTIALPSAPPPGAESMAARADEAGPEAPELLRQRPRAR